MGILSPVDDVLADYGQQAGLSIEAADGGAFLVAPRAAIDAGAVPGLALRGVRRYLTLNRLQEHPYWTRPATGTGADLSTIQQSQCLLIERDDGRVAVVLPLVDAQTRATLFGDGQTLTLRIEGPQPDPSPDAALVAYVATGDDPIGLVEQAMAAAAQRLGSFRLRQQKRLPTFIDYLGWCTWDAFYRDVNEEKIISGLRAFAAGGIQPGLVILDDGWQDVHEDWLNTFSADRTKFPNGLAPTIERAKREFGVKIFGVWHAFHGYWSGINPNGPLAREYDLVANRGWTKVWLADRPISELSMVAPRDAQRFYNDMHDALRRAGVDMVKIDNQSATEIMSAGKLPRVPTMRRWQHAMQAAAAVHFGGELLHCMCHASDIAFNMLASVVFRNSDDFFPNKPESHQRHVHENAMVAIWSSTFGLPDWDMFWSAHPQGAFHAAARAISGGPVYVSDKPGQHDFDLLRKLITSDGRLLRCDRPALPARDCVFVDQRTERRLLKMTNRNGPVGVLGLFHCAEMGESITDTFRPGDVHDVAGERFAVYLHRGQTLHLLDREEARQITLDPIEWEIATLVPLSGTTIRALGLLDKLNGSAAIVEQATDPDGAYHCVLRDGGEAGFYCPARPKRVLADGSAVAFFHDATSGLLRVPTPAGQPVRIEIHT